MSTPISDAYWVNDRFLAGEYPGASGDDAARLKLTRFIEAGVRHFIDLTEQGELVRYEELLEELAGAHAATVSYSRHPIRDAGVPEPDQMAEILACVKGAVLDGERCYVHCWGGIGRTGTVVGCWLVQEEGLSPNEAINRIATLRAGTPDAGSESPETPESAGSSRPGPAIARWLYGATRSCAHVGHRRNERVGQHCSGAFGVCESYAGRSRSSSPSTATPIESRRGLYGARLNANYYDPYDGSIWHVPGFCGLSHRCGAQAGGEATAR